MMAERSCMKALLAFTVICIGTVAAANTAFAAPIRKDRFYYEKRGEVVWEVPTDRPMIALTFDDGPNPKQTNEILDVLKQYEAKCTFFVVGKRVEAYPDVARRIVGEGHEIANHTYHHIYFQSSSSERQVQQELELAEQAINQATGQHSVLFRPPGGMFDEKLVSVANHMGLKPVIWSWHQDTKDWVRPGVYRITSRVLRNAHHGDIVLFHDFVAGKSQTKEALETILPELHKRGYQFVTVSELMKHAMR
ncbi:polysaccharide deacetylase [Paenibacillus curdlanolyticus YK9]|uniref:Polysaccharide deacetylase n=1 Tax=Paenibacillus curdlanolyticus YK9 TaxID=717606 RepID=E0IBJ6_9BACL|nr:polysaccharide deacetylase family protein [Paenibacillus curdlanolyticus]EFM10076.1 polysaccharide deacetylase [Paenibacillus curdlanolyticus YK9]